MLFRSMLSLSEARKGVMTGTTLLTALNPSCFHSVANGCTAVFEKKTLRPLAGCPVQETFGPLGPIGFCGGTG